MRRILKWQLPIYGGTATLPIGQDATVLHVGYEEPSGLGLPLLLCVWVDQGSADSSGVVFDVVLTGAQPAEGEHVGSAVGSVNGLPYVVHVYRRLS